MSVTALETYDDTTLIKLNLYHAIHNSETKSFRGCRRRWAWVYRDGYYPRVTPKALELGIAFHNAMETWYDPELWNHPDRNEVSKALAMATFAKVVKQQLKTYEKLNGPASDEVKSDYKERRDLGLKMIKYYADEISATMDGDFTPIAVEVPFQVPLGFKCTCERCFKKWIESDIASREINAVGNMDQSEYYQYFKKIFGGLPVVFGGRIDMIIQDKNGRLYIWDHKSAARILDEDAESSFLQLDDQVARYCAAMHILGHPVAGFIYSEIKKAVPEEPQRLVRALKGKNFSVSKNANTDYKTFLETVKKHDSDAYDAGLYDDYLTWLKLEGPIYFQRHQIHKNKFEITETWNNLIEEAKDILSDPRIYPQPGRFSCTTCAFKTPCIGKNMGEDYIYTLDSMFDRRTKHYYEETDEDRKLAA